MFSKEDELVSGLLKNELDTYYVTGFQENNVPINLHAVIYEDEILLFPPSIQLISYEDHRLKYIGSDFSAFISLQDEERELVRNVAENICNALQKKGYLGVCGIDMILTNENCYFMEVNGRFQASSALLNRDLVENGFPTLQAYHMDAFLNKSSSLQEPPLTAKGSMITYTYQSKNRNRLRWLHTKLDKSMTFEICDDGFAWNLKFDPESYMFQMRSHRAISSVTYQHKVRIHPNAKISSFKLDGSFKYDEIIKIKILLFTRGVAISLEVWQTLQDRDKVDWEEFDAVTLKLHDDIWITASCLDSWSELSPMGIDYNESCGNFYLCYYDKPLFPVEVMKADSYGERKTKKGHFFKDIVYMNPDRLRVYHRDGCAFQDVGLGCKFCDLYGSEKSFDFSDICEVLSNYLDDDRINHYLIGGGSELANNQCGTILKIAKFLKNNSKKHIYLMTQPINNRKILKELKSSGVTEVSFNIEMFDRSIAKQVMPGKMKNSLRTYYDSLKMAVELWGKTGNVRSVILLGFDEIKTFEQGVRELCKLGVSPILSVFHPCVGTPLENFMPFDENDALLYFKTAKSVCDEFNMKLGPSCKACQNNTIAWDF